ncbi:MAG: hypothetical protein RR495_00600 [Anaerovoracaceae bacterium]
MLKRIFRIIFTLIGVICGYGFYSLCKYIIGLSYPNVLKHLVGWQGFGIALLFAIIFGILFFNIMPSLGRKSQKVAKDIEADLSKVSTNKLVSGTMGIIVGFVVAFLLSQIYTQLEVPYLGTVLSIITYLMLGYLGFIISSERGIDAFGSIMTARKLTAVGGGRAKDKGNDATPKIFDTSVIIDGRILDIMKTGFLEGTVIIPEFVLVELRHIADSSDSLKRTRGRRGLDILKKIQVDYGIEIYNTDSEKALDEIPEVDVKLIKLAQILRGKVVTNDFNLNKVARIKDVEVLNINELANTLKPVVLPGETMELFLVKEGKERDQALAYLDDGTMIVVEHGRKFIGKTIFVTVTTVLQTSAGRMIFSKPENS